MATVSYCFGQWQWWSSVVISVNGFVHCCNNNKGIKWVFITFYFICLSLSLIQFPAETPCELSSLLTCGCVNPSTVFAPVHKCVPVLGECFRSLSCWKVNCRLSLRWCALWCRFSSRTSLTAFIFLWEAPPVAWCCPHYALVPGMVLMWWALPGVGHT